MGEVKEFRLQCPTPVNDGDHVQLAHGGGGRRMHELLEGLLLPSFRQRHAVEASRWRDLQRRRHPVGVYHRLLRCQTAVLSRRRHRHPGHQRNGERSGDVRSASALSQLGADSGRRPADGDAAASGGVDALFGHGRRSTTHHRRYQGRGQRARATGFSSTRQESGWWRETFPSRRGMFAPGDAILLSGDIGRHGIAIMATREGLSFESAVESDCAPLWEPVEALLDCGR